MLWVLAFLVALLGGLALLTQITANAASYNQAQAVRDVARVAQTNANAAQLATTALVLVLLLAALAIAYLVWRDRRRAQELAQLRQMILPPAGSLPPSGQWAPGPNARFQRASPLQALPTGGDDLGKALIAMVMLRLLEQQQPTRLPAPPPQPPYGAPGSGWEL